MRKATRLSVWAAVLLMAGCAGRIKHMQPVADPNVSYAPAENQATVIFIRPSKRGTGYQSSVFDATTEENRLIGVLAARKKVAYVTAPGRHLFMVIGEKADFMKADLSAGKTYYVVVTPERGTWLVNYSFSPQRWDVLETPLFQRWVDGCTWVENTDASRKWADDNLPSIRSKRESAFKVWDAKPEEDKPFLRPEDGK